MAQEQQQQQADQRSYAVSDPLPSLSEIRQYSDALTVAGFDKTRTLWIGNLKPWMDAAYLINFCKHVNDVVKAMVFRNNQTTELYGFIQFESPEKADEIMWAFNCEPMPNSKQIFKFKRAEFVLGEKSQAGRPDPNFPDHRKHVPARSMVNIEFVRVKHISTPKRPHSIYGTVTVKDTWGVLKLYDRDSNNFEFTDVDRCLTLTGPVAYISGDGTFVIMIKLGEDGEEIAQGNIEWDYRYVRKNYDKNLETDVDGEHGTVTVGYSMLKEARNATVEVLLIEGKTNVYGTIKTVLDIGGSETSYMMFEKLESESVSVCSNHAILLTRPIVAAPVSTGLTIEANLFDCDGQIVNGTQHFDAKFGIETKTICSKFGKVEVSVFFY